MVKTAASKRSFAKRSAPSQNVVEKRIADLIGGSQGGILSRAVAKKRPEDISKGNVRRRGALEVVGEDGTTEIVAPAPTPADEAEQQAEHHVDTGLSMLRKAVRSQSHLRKLPHQDRHDYEFLLRRVATSGVVRLFNALTQAKAIGQQQFDKAEKTTTVDKAEERKFVATRDAFLSALRTSQPTAHRV